MTAALPLSCQYFFKWHSSGSQFWYCQLCASLCKRLLLENCTALLCCHSHCGRLLSVVDMTLSHKFDKHKCQVHGHFETI